MTLHTINSQQPLFVRHVAGSETGYGSQQPFSAKLHDALMDIADEGFAAIVDIKYSSTAYAFPNGESWIDYSALILYR